MKKIILILVCGIICTSCYNKINSAYLITPLEGVGKYILGATLIDNYNTNELEIKTSGVENLIIEIAVKSSKYKTKEKFGIGSNLSEIEKEYGLPNSRELQIKKGDILIGKVGGGLIYDGIFFMDVNNDGKVDGIILIK